MFKLSLRNSSWGEPFLLQGFLPYYIYVAERLVSHHIWYNEFLLWCWTIYEYSGIFPAPCTYSRCSFWPCTYCLTSFCFRRITGCFESLLNICSGRLCNIRFTKVSTRRSNETENCRTAFDLVPIASRVVVFEGSLDSSRRWIFVQVCNIRFTKVSSRRSKETENCRTLFS